MLSFLLLCQGYAQNLNIIKPEDREVSPGDFVTLVFRLEPKSDMNVLITASTNDDWPILRQVGEQSLKAGKSKPIAVTLSIPALVKAGKQTQVNLKVENEELKLSSSVSLKVSDFHQLDLEASSELVLNQDDLKVKALNQGNISETTLLSIKQSGDLVFEQELKLEPFSSQDIVYTPELEGLLVIELSQDSSVKASKISNVIRIGLPEPEKLILTGAINTSLSSTGAWSAEAELTGSLSDYFGLDASLNATNWQRSFVEVKHEDFKVQAGKTRANPYGLTLPSGFGLSGIWLPAEHKTLSAGLSWLKEDQFGLYLAGEYRDGSSQLVAGTGLAAGSIYSETKTLFRFDGLSVQSRAYLLDKEFGLEARLDLFDAIRFYTVELSAKDLFQEGLNLAGNFNLSEAHEGDFSAGFRLSPLVKAQSDAYMAMTTDIPTPLAGQLSTGLQAGLNTSFASLRYTATLEAGWQTSSQFAINYTPEGLNLSLDSFWLETLADKLSVKGSVRYFLDADVLEASLEADGHLDLTPFEVELSADWLSPSENLSLETTVNYLQDAWTLGLSNNLGYSYGEKGGWSLALGLSADYDFSFATPKEVIDYSGGRRLGSLVGHVEAEGLALANIEIKIDRFRVQSNEMGEFRAELPPGDYDISLTTTSLPITYRLISPATLKARVNIGEETTISFKVAETTVLQGKVFEDLDGDGKADEPKKGVKAQLLLTDAEGLRRSLLSNDDGSFEVSGLVPGKAKLKINTVAAGSTIVGPAEKEIILVSGEISQAEFLVQPVIAKSQSFDSSSLRIRRVELSSDTVPPGTAPVITVSLNTDVEEVLLHSTYGDSQLELHGKSWQGRLLIPVTAASGVLEFNVIAQIEGAKTEKTGRVVIDPQAPAYNITVNGPVKPGEKLSILIDTILYPVSINISSEFGEVQAQELEPSKYEALLDIPQNTQDAIYALKLTLATAEQSFTEEQTFRVLVP